MTLSHHASLEHLTDHLFSPLAEAVTSRVAIIPGDPDRVDVLAEMLESTKEYSFRRGFRGATGTYKGMPVYVLSTGMGGPSLERTLVELRHMDVDTVLRVGTTGGLQEGIAPGDLVVNEASVRLDGTSTSFVRAEYPAAASWEAVAALVKASHGSGLPTHVGIGATTSSFFAGQGRATFSGWERPDTRILNEISKSGVLNFEMEAATLFTLARLFGMRAGSVCAVVNNRIGGVMGGKESIPIACRVALEAAFDLCGSPVTAGSDHE